MRRFGRPAGLGVWAAVLAVFALFAWTRPVGAGATQQAVVVCGPRGGRAVAVAQTPVKTAEYVIGQGDKLSIRVFDVKQLSLDEETVDATGQIELPLVGVMTAAGKTPVQLQAEIAQRLGDRYLQSPQVAVLVLDSASQKVTVEGAVKTPGVFQMKGRVTLMQAIAMAGGPSDTADLHKVAVIREDGGYRHAAVCDYARISRGQQIDPPLQGEDIVVVDDSLAKTIWHETVTTLPAFSLFAYLR